MPTSGYAGPCARCWKCIDAADVEANVIREGSRQSVGKWARERRWAGEGVSLSWGEFEFIPCVVEGRYHEHEFTPDLGDQHGTAGQAAKYDRRVTLRAEAKRLQTDKAGSAEGQRWRRHPRRRATLAALEGSWDTLLRHAAFVAETYEDGTEAQYAASLLICWKDSESERKAGGGFAAGWELGAKAGLIRAEWLLWAVWGPQLSTALRNRDDDGGSAARRGDWLNDQIRKRWPLITHDKFGRPLSFSGRMAAVSENIRDANPTVFASSPNLAKALEPNALRQRLNRLGFTAKAAS